jgi:tRNA(adenine34) deaminase
MNEQSSKFMQLALEQAKIAAQNGEVPIGAVIVKDEQILASAYNQIESLKDACAHAEIQAIKAASNKLESWRLDGCQIYTTLEPCPMCMGAIRLSRISKIYIANTESRMGAISKFPTLASDPELGPVPEIHIGILQQECQSLLKQFFKDLRKK